MSWFCFCQKQNQLKSGVDMKDIFAANAAQEPQDSRWTSHAARSRRVAMLLILAIAIALCLLLVGH